MTILPLNAHMRNHIIVTRECFRPRDRSYDQTHGVAVVCFVSDLSLKALRPNPWEVDRVFTHPLKGCHTGVLAGTDMTGLAEKGGEHWPHQEELHVSEPASVGEPQKCRTNCDVLSAVSRGSDRGK